MNCPHQNLGVCGNCASSLLNVQSAIQGNGMQNAIAAQQAQYYKGLSNQPIYSLGPSWNMGAQSDQEYQMFQKYAHLEDGELIRLFLSENQDIIKVAEETAARMIEQAKAAQKEHDNKFWTWCAKFRKQLTPERVKNLISFL